MFDLIRLLTESILKVIPYIADHRHKKEMTDLGVRLFIFYLRLQECAVSADRILRLLGSYVTNPDFYGSAIEDEIKEQILNMSRLTSMSYSIGWALTLLEADVKISVDVFINAKEDDLNAVGLVLNQMEQGRLPLAMIDSELYSRLIGYSRSLEPTSPGSRITGPASTLRRALDDAIRAGDFLDLKRDPDADTVAIVRTYLDSGVPQKRLTEIRNVLDQLHRVLTENFSLAELLPAIGKTIRKQE
jgi:hypothetical protein